MAEATPGGVRWEQSVTRQPEEPAASGAPPVEVVAGQASAALSVVAFVGQVQSCTGSSIAELLPPCCRAARKDDDGGSNHNKQNKATVLNAAGKSDFLCRRELFFIIIIEKISAFVLKKIL